MVPVLITVNLNPSTQNSVENTGSISLLSTVEGVNEHQELMTIWEKSKYISEEENGEKTVDKRLTCG